MLGPKILLISAGLVAAAVIERRQESPSPTVPDYFQTTPEIYAGPTVTGLIAPFLAQTNPAPFGQEASFVANAPLETNVPIQGNTRNQSIFQLHGQLSSYFSPSQGFGAQEWPLPPGANISIVNVLHRHGSRYPTGTSSVASFGSKIHNITANGTAKWSGELSFLNSWKYQLGAEILVARGRQELFDSGVLFYYNYGEWQCDAEVRHVLTRSRWTLQYLDQDRCPNHDPRPNAQVSRVFHGRILWAGMDS